jgi:hypothetical protein
VAIKRVREQGGALGVPSRVVTVLSAATKGALSFLGYIIEHVFIFHRLNYISFLICALGRRPKRWL